MIVLGVDGGSRRAGAAVVKFGPDGPQLLDARLIRMDIQPWTDRRASERLYFLFSTIAALTTEWRPDLVGVELSRVRNGGKHRNLDAYLVTAKSQQSAVLGALHGAIAADLTGLRVVEVPASQIRSRLRIKARATDAAKEAVRTLFNKLCPLELQIAGFNAPDGPVPDSMYDVTDAIAVAWTAPCFVAEPEHPDD